MESNRELWAAYRRTWKAFAMGLDAWQQAVDADKERLRGVMEEARAAHQSARDALAEHLTSREHRVRNTAKMIWELSGRPAGTAESDWYRAEKLWR